MLSEKIELIIVIFLTKIFITSKDRHSSGELFSNGHVAVHLWKTVVRAIYRGHLYVQEID